MKIKRVCEITGLTERTIRFYIERGLIQPSASEMNGRVYHEYSTEDIAKIEQIAILRKVGFSITEISEMETEPQKIDKILDLHRVALAKDAKALSEKIDALRDAQGRHFTDIGELCRTIQAAASKLELPSSDVSLDFGRFDTETKEEKQDAYIDFLAHERLRENTANFFKPFVTVLKLCLAALLLLLVVYGFSCIPKTVNREYTGAKYRIGSSETLINTEIHIEGKLYRRLFQAPAFKGLIEFSDVEDSQKYEAQLLFSSGMDEPAALSYAGVRLDESGSSPYINMYAILRTDRDFNYVILNVFEPEGADSKSLKDLVIVAPARNAGEGDRIIAAHGLVNTYPFNGEFDK